MSEEKSWPDRTSNEQTDMLVTNAVVLWNTVYMSAVLDQLKAQGYPVADADVAHLASTLREHQSLREISLQRRRRIPPEGSPPTEATRFRISLALFFVQLLSQHRYITCLRTGNSE